MQISNRGLDEIERAAEKERSAETLLLVQILRELRQLAGLLEQQNQSGHSSDN